MSDIVFQTMITEATDRVRRLVNRGRPVHESVDQIIAELELTEKEGEALKVRTKKMSPKKAAPAPKQEVVAVKEDLIDEALGETLAESIYFNTIEEASQATGILMYKSIPWTNKGEEGDRHFMQFESREILEKAKDALKRRWEFVENRQRKVAVVEFDNLQDYDKVLEYMNKQGMMLEWIQSGDQLDEDADLEEALVQETAKRAARDGAELSEAPQRPLSLAARSKDARADIAGADVIKESGKRKVSVRRRWK
jgi:hypothetical protein